MSGTAAAGEVVITGIGTLCCVGSGADAFWQGMNAAKSLPQAIPDPLAHMPHPLMYLVPEADLPDGPREQDGLPLGRGSQFALAAARQALADAGLAGPFGEPAGQAGPSGPAAARPVPGGPAHPLDPRRVAVLISTGMGDAHLQEQWRTGAADKPDRWVPDFPVAAVVGGWLGAEGANTSISNACAASGYALSMAADLIRSGEADLAVVGGAEAYSRVALACFNRLGAMDPERCRPFAAGRRGTLFGEGAAVLVLESAEHARRRGARAPYATLAGAGWSCDAHHATAPEPGGAEIERAMRSAFAEAATGSEGLGFVVPHGTGTELNDVVESETLARVLGAAASGVPAYSLKALIGHTGSAAAAFGTAAAALILHHRTVPPNVPVGEPDPRCDIPLPAAATPVTAPYGLVNAYAFGGNNISLLLTEAAA